MAIATARAIDPDILEERWQQATWRPQPFTDGTVGPKQSGASQRLTDALEAIGARLVENMELNDDERSGLADQAMEILGGPIKHVLTEWAEGIEQARMARRVAATAVA